MILSVWVDCVCVEFVPSVISVPSMGSKGAYSEGHSEGDTVNSNTKLCDKLCMA